MDTVIDNLLESGMIMLVSQNKITGDFMCAGFLVLKPKNPRKAKFVIDYSSLKFCFDRVL